MSLFDKLRCDYPLPDPELQKAEFHSKDLGCALAQYRIDRQGRLWVKPMQLRLDRRDKKPRKPVPPIDTRFHGEFCFYAHAKRTQVEYQARFTHGNLEWIRRVAQEDPSFTDSLTWLARDGRYLEQEGEKQRMRLLQRLEQFDREVAKKAIKAFKSRSIAASWLIAGSSGINGLSPVEALAKGKRKTVLKVIAEIHEFCR